MSNTRIFEATEKRAVKMRVYLGNEDVSERCMRGLFSERPRDPVTGWVDLLPPEPKNWTYDYVLLEPITQRWFGLVKWEWR